MPNRPFPSSPTAWWRLQWIPPSTRSTSPVFSTRRVSTTWIPSRICARPTRTSSEIDAGWTRRARRRPRTARAAGVVGSVVLRSVGPGGLPVGAVALDADRVRAVRAHDVDLVQTGDRGLHPVGGERDLGAV